MEIIDVFDIILGETNVKEFPLDIQAFCVCVCVRHSTIAFDICQSSTKQ